jgi:hypothetical protein
MNLFQNLFERQKRQFATGETRNYAWRIERLGRMARLIRENEAALQRAAAHDCRASKTAFRARPQCHRWITATSALSSRPEKVLSVSSRPDF